MHDPFEESLKALLSEASDPQAQAGDDRARLDRVLKTANRQVGAGALFNLVGRHWISALLLALGNGAPHARSHSRRASRSADTPRRS